MLNMIQHLLSEMRRSKKSNNFLKNLQFMIDFHFYPSKPLRQLTEGLKSPIGDLGVITLVVTYKS